MDIVGNLPTTVNIFNDFKYNLKEINKKQLQKLKNEEKDYLKEYFDIKQYSLKQIRIYYYFLKTYEDFCINITDEEKSILLDIKRNYMQIIINILNVNELNG
jgi:hypothetical protein